jgi:CheY-like chemotaxis protein
MARFRILIVDDNREVRHMLAEGVKTLDAKFDVLEVPSAEEALLISSSLPLDLVVTHTRTENHPGHRRGGTAPAPPGSRGRRNGFLL